MSVGISLDSICEKTKISRYFLEAIEEGAYERLPGGVFDINYIRQYSEQIGYAPELLLAHYRLNRQRPDAAAVEAQSGRSWWRAFL